MGPVALAARLAVPVQVAAQAAVVAAEAVVRWPVEMAVMVGLAAAQELSRRSPIMPLMGLGKSSTSTFQAMCGLTPQPQS